MKKIAIIISCAALLSACGQETILTPVTVTPTMTVPPTNTATTNKEYTLADVAKHNKDSDCWFVIHDKVYNVTSYIAAGQHPGGEIIETGCGKDATQLFENRPGEGTPHSDMAKNYLNNFEIGKLKK